jgi:hypothetical protein
MYDEEINDILNSIKPGQFKPLNIVKDIRENVVESIFSKFMNYEINKQNLEDSLNILEHYEYIENNDDIKIGDKLRYFNTSMFYDLRLTHIVSIIDINDRFIIRNGQYINNIKKNKHFFKFIPKDDLVKMKLLELIDE